MEMSRKRAKNGSKIVVFAENANSCTLEIVVEMNREHEVFATLLTHSTVRHHHYALSSLCESSNWVSKKLGTLIIVLYWRLYDDAEASQSSTNM